uniref:Uncharacterized protein n=4 Tax=Avena sativa TaxID=4498 RepID=A0ACD6AL26_AVESA
MSICPLGHWKIICMDQEALGNPGSTGAVPPAPPLRCYNASVSASAEAAAPSGGFACAVAALAEQQHMLGDSSSAATCQTSRYDVLSRSERSFTEDLSIAGSSSSGTRVEEPSNSRTRQTQEGGEYSNNDGWSEVAEAGTSFASSDVTVDAGAANLAASDVSSIGLGAR